MEQSFSVAAVAETMVAQRRRLFIGFALGFSAWEAGRVVNDLLPASSPWRGDVIVLGLLGYVVWAVCTLRFFAFIKALKRNPPVSAVLQDELAQQTNSKALRVAFGATLAALSLVRTVASFHPFPATAATDIPILAAVIAYFVAFLVLERD